MGGDTSPSLFLSQVVPFLTTLESKAEFLLIGTETYLKKTQLPPHIHSYIVQEVITMEDAPLIAVKRKKNSSLCTGIHLLKEKKIDAFISTGNTGALVASAITQLPTLSGIDKPALLALLPTKKHDIAVLDVGAHISCKAIHLIQFAYMGIAYQKSRGIHSPKVGLLNIGIEAKKGTKEHIEAYKKLQNLPGFIGNIEGREAFQGTIDVLVTDGFTGNVFLKTAEGIATCVLEQLEEKSPELSLLSDLRNRLHYSEHPGALICGIEGIVIKCHGSSPPPALISSIKAALRLIEHDFLENLKHELENKNYLT